MNFPEILYSVLGGIVVIALCAWMIDEPYH